MEGHRSPERLDTAPLDRGRFYRDVYALVARIPVGRVTTYGDIALALGRPRNARYVGQALAALATYTDAASAASAADVPAHRVVHSRGEISRAWENREPGLQAALLRDEGVTFTADGRVDLRRHICDLPSSHSCETGTSPLTLRT